MASEDGVVAQSLECCLCFELFSQPKLLTCAHTFCKECLDHLYKCHPQQNHLSCPICRQTTKIKKGDISRLKTNILISSMVEDMKTVKKSCTVCDPEAKSPASQYCVQCDEYMCDPCTAAHRRFKKNAKHDVVSMDDVKIAKVKVKRFCTKHPDEEKLYVCTSCNVSICFRCHMLYHGKPDHNITEVSDYKKTFQKKIEFLQSEAEIKIGEFRAHAELADEQQPVVEVEFDQRIAEINQSYEEAVKYHLDNLTRERDDLIARCKQEMAALITQLEKIKVSDGNTISCIESASQLVGNGVRALLEGQTLDVHNRICSELKSVLSKHSSKPDANHVKSIADLAKRWKFTQSITPNSSSLGELQRLDWKLEHVREFPLSHRGQSDAVALSNGHVVVSNWDVGAIGIVSVNGPQETVMDNWNVRSVSVLSDGSYVVRGDNNKVRLYTQAWEKKDHYTFRWDPNTHLIAMCVDRDDNIYVSSAHHETKTIIVFRLDDGSRRNIQCHDFKPKEICHMNHSKRLVVTNGEKSVRVIDDRDEEGTVLHHIQVVSHHTRIAVRKDDSILIACMKNWNLSITLYTKDLKCIRRVLKNFYLPSSIYKLVELSTGEIAVVSWHDFFVFRKI